MSDSRSIGILAYDGVDARSLVTVHDVSTTVEQQNGAVDVTVFSLVPSDGVTSATGLELVPDDVLIGTPDVVVVPGGVTDGPDGPAPSYPTELPERLGQLAAAGATVVGIGTGALALGEAELLTERSATTAEPFRDDLSAYAETVSDQAVVDAGAVLTAEGPEAALSVARLLAEDACEEAEHTTVSGK